MARLVLVRHAPTAETGRTLTGRLPGSSLTDEGRAMAESVADQLGRVRLAAIYASPLERTRQTADAIARVQRREVRNHDGLLEIDYGQWSGRSLRSLYPLKSWRMVMHYPSRVRFPGGESLAAAQARAVATCEELAARHRRQTIGLVTHADVIKAVVSHYLGQPLDLFGRLAVAPASVSVLDLPAGGQPRLVALNGNGDPKTWK
ncbi:MAG: histidine phosphatase family protein [Actinomycetota bacterium]